MLFYMIVRVVAINTMLTLEAIIIVVVLQQIQTPHPRKETNLFSVLSAIHKLLPLVVLLLLYL